MIATRLSRVPPFERGLTLGDFLVPIRLGERAAIWQRNLLMVLVGTALMVVGAYVSFEGAYSGAPYVGYIDDGGAFAGFAGHVQTVTDILKMNGTTLQSNIILQSDTRPTL